MITDARQIVVGGLRVDVVRKAIKNLHLGVYPPDGRVRVAPPVALSDAAVRAAVAGKLGWIRRQQRAFKAQLRESARGLISGESHYFLGRRYRLSVVPTEGRPMIAVKGQSKLELRAAPGSSAEQRMLVLPAP